MLTRLPFALLGAVLGCGLFAMPAQAQRARVFVASYGNDSNPCSFGSPCRTFQAAHDAVAANGEVTAIDSAGFGPLNINKAVTITSPPGIEASIAAAAGGSAIAVAAGFNDVVTLRGLTLNGGGSGGYGINFTAGAKLAVIDCVVSNYAQYGIVVNVTGTTSVLISNTAVSDTAGGIVLATSGTSGTISAMIDRSTFDNNVDGIEVIDDAGSPSYVVVSNSTFGTNKYIGLYMKNPSSTHFPIVTVKNVTFGVMQYDIYLAGFVAAYLSQVTQAPNNPGVVGIQCADLKPAAPDAVALYLDNTTNHLWGISSGCGSTLGVWD